MKKGKFFFYKKYYTLGQTVKFSVVNLTKPDSLYNNGMRPCIWSKGLNEKECKLNQI